MKKKLAIALSASLIASSSSTVLNVFANDILKKKAVSIEKKAEKSMTVDRFSLKDYKNFEEYNKLFKIKVSSIESKGGSQPNSPLKNAIDGNIQTHWESYEKNTDKKAEVIFGFDKIEDINRIAYQVRQDGASKGKGFPIGAEIYVSTEDTGDDNFELAGKADGTQISHDMVEFKFDTVKAKRVKFVFTEVSRGWASAAEFWLYREDESLNKMNNLFTDSSKSKVNEKFNTKEKLDKLEEEVKSHPLYDEVFKKDIDHARKLIDKIDKELEKSMTVDRFSLKDYKNFEEYNKLFKIKVSSIESKGGSQPNSPLENAIDGNIQTHWESYEKNTDKKAEVIFGFDKIEDINRIAYQVRQDGASKGKGFPIGAEIYVSTEDTGDDNFELAGKADGTRISHDMVEFKFDTVKAKRVKFVFTEVSRGWASAAEFWLYREDESLNKMDNLFTDSSKSKVNKKFNTKEKLDKLEEEVKSHPLYDEVFKKDIDNARILIEKRNKEVEKNTIVNRFSLNDSKNFEEYNKLFKIKVSSIESKGGSQPNSPLKNAIDGNIQTHWESYEKNTDKKAEVIFGFDKIEDINRIAYQVRQDGASKGKGFPIGAEIYVSTEDTGDDNFELAGKADGTQISHDMVEFKFDTVKAKRVKFVFTEVSRGWASAAEFWLYREDESLNKMNNLFTDSSKSKVNEKFNTKEKLDKLEEEVKSHPLYDEVFKKDIDNARKLIDKIDKELEKSMTVYRFSLNDSKNFEEYNKLFKIKVSSIESKGGSQPNSPLENAIDGNIQTHWESYEKNTDKKAEVIFGFDKIEDINRIAYQVRQDGASKGKGFPIGAEIYVSTEDTGDDNFELAGKADGTQISHDMVEFKFDTVKAKRVKFVFTEVSRGWASAAEFWLYREDKLDSIINGMFTDGTMSKLKDEYKDINVINKLEEEVNKHPLKDKFITLINLAKELLKGEKDYSDRTFTLVQNGDTRLKATDTLLMRGSGDDFQSTGIVAKPGEVFNIFVEAEDGKPLPSIVFTQQEGHFGNWRRNYQLKKGINTIVVPEIYSADWSKKSVKGGAVYLVNKYTQKEQGKAPIVRIDGGERFPLFNTGDNKEEFLKELKAYKKKLDENPNTMVDIFEFNTKRLMLTGTTKAAYQVYVNEGVDIEESIAVWNNQLEKALAFAGLKDDISDPTNDSTNIRTVIRLMQPYGAAYAAGDHIGIQRSIQDIILRTDNGSINSVIWGTLHEAGHQMDIKPRTWGEVTNNMWANYASISNGKSDRVPYNSIYNMLAPEESTKGFEDFDLSQKLGMFWQLQLKKNTYWQELERMYRKRRPNPKDYQEKKDILAIYSSEIIGMNLTHYFEKYGFNLSEECKNDLKRLPESNEKIWYLNTKAMNYTGNGFSREDTGLKVSLSKLSSGIKLSMDINKDMKGDLLGYEIVKNGKVIGFTSGDSYIDANAREGEDIKYDIIPYAVNLKTGHKVEINSNRTNIKPE